MKVRHSIESGPTGSNPTDRPPPIRPAADHPTGSNPSGRRSRQINRTGQIKPHRPNGNRPYTRPARTETAARQATATANSATVLRYGFHPAAAPDTSTVPAKSSRAGRTATDRMARPARTEAATRQATATTNSDNGIALRISSGRLHSNARNGMSQRSTPRRQSAGRPRPAQPARLRPNAAKVRQPCRPPHPAYRPAEKQERRP